MEEALQIAWEEYIARRWSKDKYERYRDSCFKAALQARVGGDIWAKLFLVCGTVNQHMVDLVNANFEDRCRS